MDVAQELGSAVGEASADALEARIADLYERRGRELWGLARRLGASDEEAADVVHPDGWGVDTEPPGVQHRRCAERFVITSIEPAVAP